MTASGVSAKTLTGDFHRFSSLTLRIGSESIKCSSAVELSASMVVFKATQTYSRDLVITHTTQVVSVMITALTMIDL